MHKSRHNFILWRIINKVHIKNIILNLVAFMDFILEQ